MTAHGVERNNAGCPSSVTSPGAARQSIGTSSTLGSSASMRSSYTADLIDSIPQVELLLIS
jgi:hypothetical protein